MFYLQYRFFQFLQNSPKVFFNVYFSCCFLVFFFFWKEKSLFLFGMEVATLKQRLEFIGDGSTFSIALNEDITGHQLSQR